MIRRALLLPLALAVLVSLAFAEPGPPVVLPVADALLADVTALAAPEMEGRASGTPGNERAARFIADRLAALGLRPGGDDGTYFQPFAVSQGMRVAAGTELEILGPSPRRLETGREWTPHGGSQSGDLTAEVVFVGYGVADERCDDYAGVDVRGKIALALDGAPAHASGARASRLEKLLAARRHGASALLIAGESLPPLAATDVHVRLLSGAIIYAAADALLAPSSKTAAGLALAINASGRPASFTTGSRASLSVRLETEPRRTANVIGVLPGTDPARAGDVVVLGAHFDHLGRVGDSLHPGADDNASGTSVVLGLARAFASAGGAPETLVFALFSGEEVGLLGSAHYARHPALPLSRTVAMLNFDMVGRMRGRSLNVGGVESGIGLRALVSEVAAAERVDVALQGTPFSPSDHVSFYSAGTPVLFFYTGEHADYHTPRDTADKIDAAGMADVARVAARIVERLGAGARPVYVTLTRPSRERRFAAARGGAFLGISPDSSSEADGLRLGSVLAGTAAARAGLLRGDVIVRLADRPVNGFADLRRIIDDKRPGDAVAVVYLRDGEEHHAAAVLDSRP